MILIIEPTLNTITFGGFKYSNGEYPYKSIFKTAEECRSKDMLVNIINEFFKDEEIKAISLRILFGGESFSRFALITDAFFPTFRKLISIRPSYIASVLQFIENIYGAFPDIPILAFFETGLFLELSEAEKCYAISEDYFQDTLFGKWGYHSIWHYYNAEIPEEPNKTISIVLDRATTVCALNKNLPVTVSFWGTPLAGIMGEKSCGDIDPGIVFYLMKKHNYSINKVDEILKKQSGFYGLTGYESEIGDLIKYFGSDKKVDLAFEIYLNQIKKYIGESIAMLGGISDIIFSGRYVRALIPIIFSILKDISIFDINLQALPWESEEKIFRISLNNSNVNVSLNKTALPEIIFLQTKEYISELS